ncbi:MAG: SDR family oxidoreductase [Brevefilum sp.]|nr:SDR family oxidoreductase [Brevefilum sp.]
MENNHWSLQDKNILITGSSQGIGFFTALGLAGKGAHVIIVSHDEEHSKQAVEEINNKCETGSARYYVADLSSQREIRELAEKVKQDYDQLDVLINNAGAWFSRHRESDDGIEKTFALNHLSYFLLTGLLIDLINKNTSTRIINVSSDAHRASYGIRFDDIGFQTGYRPFMTYAQSKLANIMFTYELANRLEGTNITVNVLHPGAVASNLYRNFGILEPLINLWIKISGKTSEEGAKTSIYLASSAEVSDITGKYFTDEKQKRSSNASYNEESWKQLWKLSEEMTGFEYPV